jgi:uncharacterized protein YndB with AHSA1/START domain
MNKVIIQKSIDINAPAEQVWKVLTEDSLNRQWFAEFSEGTYADTDWKQGSKAVFVDATKCGIIGHIEETTAPEKLVVVYDGQVVNGEEDFTSEVAQQIKGGKESYYLAHNNGTTQLKIEQDSSDEYYDMMSGMWDKALQKIKKLSEQ